MTRTDIDKALARILAAALVADIRRETGDPGGGLPRDQARGRGAPVRPLRDRRNAGFGVPAAERRAPRSVPGGRRPPTDRHAAPA